MPVSAPARALAWEGLLNARDTGGLATTDGELVRDGALVRSDVLTRLSPAGRAALVDHGVRTIVDVRSVEEVQRDAAPHPFRDAASQGEPVVTYLNVPFMVSDSSWAQMHAAYSAAQTREELNRLDLDTNRVGLGAIVATIADAAPGGVLVHCHAGKDRTGLVVALILSFLGVSDDDVADDYALTAASLEALIADWLDEMSSDEAERSRLRALADPRREAMLDTLAYLRSRYGSAGDYLRGAGVSDAQLQRLRQRLVGGT